jgi:hypothetical protein
MSVAEMARMGGLARAERYSKAQLRKWAKQGGRRPYKLVGETVRRLRAMLAAGKSHAEISKRLGLSLRTIGRVVAAAKPTRRAGRKRVGPPGHLLVCGLPVRPGVPWETALQSSRARAKHGGGKYAQ